MDESPGLAGVTRSERADQGPPGGTCETTESPCPSNRWTCLLEGSVLLNYATGERLAMDCKRWSCVEHGPKLAWRWRTRVSMVPWKLMLTLTNVPEDQAAARRGWQRMSRWLKGRGMSTYLRVMELGSEHGMRHWHILIDTPFVDVRELSAFAVDCGLGQVVWASKVKSREGATWYLLGYVFKSLGVENERQKGWRKLTVSRNIPSWQRVLEARHGASDDDPPSRWVVTGNVGSDHRLDGLWEVKD